jgi:Na+/alanine symporter
MDLHALNSVRELVWLWIVGPAVLLAGLVLTLRLGLPQFLRVKAAWQGLSADDAEAPGLMPPAASVALSTAAAHGAAAALGAATAVSLGGPGVLPWVWLGAFLIAPLRVGEVLLARTAPAGAAAGGVPGSLAVRLVRDGGWRPVGWLLLALVGVGAFAWGGGAQGEALAEIARGVVPEGARAIVAGVALLAIALGVAGGRRVGALAGYVALVALILVGGVALLAALSRPERALAVFVRALGDVFAGAAQTSAWSGALVGEIARTALVSAFAPLAATVGAAGALDAQARARSTKGHAATALVGPIAYALVSSLVVMALVGTGAFSEAREETRPLSSLRVYETEFETVSQRLERDRLRNGFMRVRAGELRDLSLRLAGERAVLFEPRFTYYGGPADVALGIEDGVVTRIMRPDRSALMEIPLKQTKQVLVRGQTVPIDGSLLAVAAAKAPGGRVAAQALLAALALLSVVAAGALALAMRETFAALLGARAGLAASLLPGVGLGLVALGWTPWLAPLGAVVAGVTAALVALVLLVRSGEIARLWR